MKVLFLCLGNICRSPLAEGAFRKLVAERELAHAFEIDSAGTGGWHAGESPDARSVRIAADNGVDIAHQRARQLTTEDFARCDWIVAMDADNFRTAGARRPKGERFARARLVSMLDFAPDRPDLDGVPDPYYGDLDGFRDVWKLLTAAMPEFLAHISRHPGSTEAAS